MERYFLLLATIITVISIYGQTSPPPNAFKYQAIVRDVAGEPQASINVSFEIIIKRI